MLDRTRQTETDFMNANLNDTAETLHRAGRDAAADFRRRGTNVKDYASDELKAFLADVEDLVKKVANVSDADVARLRSRVAGAIGDVREAIGDTAGSLRDRARMAVTVTDDYVHDRPWTAIGLAAAVGVIVGVGVSAASRR
jgi:ElaB/YqjD/DUF883 family membrane-anchored ribosome-binding protein